MMFIIFVANPPKLSDPVLHNWLKSCNSFCG